MGVRRHGVRIGARGGGGGCVGGGAPRDASCTRGTRTEEFPSMGVGINGANKSPTKGPRRAERGRRDGAGGRDITRSQYPRKLDPIYAEIDRRSSRIDLDGSNCPLE